MSKSRIALSQCMWMSHSMRLMEGNMGRALHHKVKMLEIVGLPRRRGRLPRRVYLGRQRRRSRLRGRLPGRV